MVELLSRCGFPFVFLTLGAYWLGYTCRQKLKLAVFNPILIATLLVMGVLRDKDYPSMIRAWGYNGYGIVS